VYRYWRHPILLIQVNIENKDILYIHVSNHGKYRVVFDCSFLFIPATNLDDTKAIFDDQATNSVTV
jgi:hypothetical protein